MKNWNIMKAHDKGASIQKRRKYSTLPWQDTDPNWNFDYWEFRVKQDEPKWYEDIPKHGVLCFVSDTEQDRTHNVVVIYEYFGDTIFPFRGVRAWKYATPLTNDEMDKFKR